MPGTPKSCTICGIDCSGKPRTKDSKGRYFCQDCYQKAKQRKASQQPHLRASSVEPALGDESETYSMLRMLVPDAPAAGGRAAAGHCTSCGSPLAADAVICVGCGYNRQTGEKLNVQRMSAPKKQVDLSGATKVLANPALVGLMILAIMGAFLAIAWSDRQMLTAYLTVDAIFGLAVGILVLVSAFKEGIGTGFLTLCVPCYVLYFILAVCESAWVKVLFGVSILLRIMGVIAATSSGMTLEEIRGF